MDPFRSVPVLSKGAGLWTPAFISHWYEAAWAEYGHSKFLALVGTGKENQAKGLKGASLTSIVELGPEEDLSVLGIQGLEEDLSRQKPTCTVGFVILPLTKTRTRGLQMENEIVHSYGVY